MVGIDTIYNGNRYWSFFLCKFRRIHAILLVSFVFYL